jgi:hypothetical protein
MSPFDDNALDRAIDDEARALTGGGPSPQFTARVLARRAARGTPWRSSWLSAQTAVLASLTTAVALFLIAAVFRPAPPGRPGPMPGASQAALPPAVSVPVGPDSQGSLSSQGSPAPPMVSAVRAPARAGGVTRWNALPSDADTPAIVVDDIAVPVLTVDPIAVPVLDIIAPIAIAPIDEGDRP